jgi:HSP20 family protein
MFERFFPALRRTGESGTAKPSDLYDMMEEMWRSPMAGLAGEGGFAVDVSETDQEVLVKAEMPGFEAKDIDLTLRNNLLTLKGEKKQEKEEKGENFFRSERSYGMFTRTIALPAQVVQDKVNAKYDKGVLTVRLPKSEPSVSTRIQIDA